MQTLFESIFDLDLRSKSNFTGSMIEVYTRHYEIACLRGEIISSKKPPQQMKAPQEKA